MAIFGSLLLVLFPTARSIYTDASSARWINDFAMAICERCLGLAPSRAISPAFFAVSSSIFLLPELLSFRRATEWVPLRREPHASARLHCRSQRRSRRLRWRDPRPIVHGPCDKSLCQLRIGNVNLGNDLVRFEDIFAFKVHRRQDEELFSGMVFHR